MKLEDIRIYNKDLELICVIPQFIAVNWEIKFSEYGTGEIELAANEDIVSLLTENEYLFLVQGDIQSLITGYRIDKSCTIFTRTLEWLLTKFIVTEVSRGSNLSDTVKNILMSLPDSFNLSFYGIDDTEDMSEYALDRATDVYSAIQDCIKDTQTGLSLRVDFGEKKFTFSLKKPSENKDILLCDDYKTSYDSIYTHDIQSKADGSCYYHKLTYMGLYDVKNNDPKLIKVPENFGKYYTACSAGKLFGVYVNEGDMIACMTKDGMFQVIKEVKPFLVKNPPEIEGIFSWSAVLDANSESGAKKELNERASMDMLTLKTRLVYGKDYKIGDIVRTKFSKDKFSMNNKQLVSGVHLWVEREGTGASPTMVDVKEV